MKKLIFVLAVSVMFLFTASAVMAQPYDPAMCDDAGTPTPCEAGNGFDVYDAINYVFTESGMASPALTSNDDANAFRVLGADSYWSDFGDGSSSNFAAISITAGAMNSLGVHASGIGALGAGTFSEVVAPQTGDQFLGGSLDLVTPASFPGGMNPLADEDFAFALFSDASSDNYWSSDPSLNSDGIDKMLTYFLPGLAGATFDVDTDGDGTVDETITLTESTYLLAWEDRPDDWPTVDWDYNDTIFLVTRVVPVPEPLSMVLFGTGMAAMAGVRRRKRS